MALKLDMSKAYDRVELVFLEKVMRHVDFDGKIISIGLQGLLHKAEATKAIRGVSIYRNGPRVSHLFFADDSVLFCRAQESECHVILDISFNL